MKNLVITTLLTMLGAFSFGQNVPLEIKDSCKVLLSYSDGIQIEFTTSEHTTIMLDEKLSVFIDIRNIRTNEVVMLHKEKETSVLTNLWE